MVDSTVLYCVAGLAATIGLLAHRVHRVRSVRYERYNELHRKYAHLLDDMSKMTYQEAEDIAKSSSFYDMPWTITVSLSFALFKTYAIPTIAAVLCKSGQLSSAESSGRRAEDTAIVIGELAGGGVERDDMASLDSERACMALSRMNWLHSRYGNLITNDDKLFTLALFIFEPFRWCEAIDFRPLSELEREARYVNWREIGARMGITDIPDTRQKMFEWQAQYMEEKMVYDPRNAKVGNSTFSVILKDMPHLMRPFGKKMGLVFLDDIQLRAFGWEKPPAWMYWVVPRLLRLKAVIAANLLFPAHRVPSYVGTTVCGFANLEDGLDSKDMPSSGPKEAKICPRRPLIQRDGFIFEPYYTRPGTSRLGALGFGKVGEDKYIPTGYDPARLGPLRLANQGVTITLKNAAAMRERAKQGPFYSPPLQTETPASCPYSSKAVGAVENVGDNGIFEDTHTNREDGNAADTPVKARMPSAPAYAEAALPQAHAVPASHSVVAAA